ncbi:cytochrome P450 monooxygenase dtxS2 [Colletotrichum spaethianum]|uniref:Cytochrome P450 monooxygenase dtxS2 n=1 Tax=Colletotrichum spaethianum TaxID=700344 RepID=A0AA37NVH9_9PEZI|nr:cytochrome P450 monooxygenase dtxS2 [Colletotrichum spaethianum]GKT40265.1 cytochrome P450 monooxygenase dtxS2 [Colletotrichum spaethianum]
MLFEVILVWSGLMSVRSSLHVFITMGLSSFFPKGTGPISQIAILAVSSWLLLYIVKGIYQAYFHPLRHVPGPKLWTIFPFIPKVKTLLGTIDQDIRHFHQKYGNAVRYTPDAVSFTTAEAWKTIYGHGHGQFPKYFSNKLFDPQSNILTADDMNHARIRRGVAHAFSPRSLAEQEPIIHGYVNKLVQRLSDVAESRMPTEMGRWFHIVSFDIVGDLTFGESLGGLENNELHHVVNSVLLFIERGKKIFEFNSLLGPLAMIVMPFLARDVQKGFMDQYNFTKKAVNRRLANDSEEARKDFMKGLQRGRDEKTLNSIEEIITNSNTLFVAGSDTTATLMTACIFYLLSAPHTHKRAVEEVRQAFESADDINFINATARLPYLLAVLNETLRLYPPVPASLERVVPNTGELIYIEGMHIPHGTRVGVHQSSAGLSTSNFAQPESFLPERWLPNVAQDPSSPFYADKRDAIQPFSYGPRNCVGKHLAYNEMRLIMARLLWEFDMKLGQSSREWTQPYSKHKAWAIWKKPPLVVHIKKRRSST